MKSIFKRTVFTDEWFDPIENSSSSIVASVQERIAYCRFPRPARTHRFSNYVLGYRWEATRIELEKINKWDLFQKPALQLRDCDPAITFAEILGVELIPEINPSQQELLKIETRVQQAALMWQHSLASMPK